MSKKSVLILAMSCNGEQNKRTVREWSPLWGGVCDKYENMEWLVYTGSEGQPNSIDWNSHIAYIDAPDDVPGTYIKTAACFKYLEDTGILGKYDYIFRTNDSTWINVDLLEMFVNSLQNDDPAIYTGSVLIDCRNKPIKFAPLAQGNGILIRREYIAYIQPNVFNAYKKRYQFNEGTQSLDDAIMSQCFNCMFMDRGINPWYMFKSFGRFAVCMRNSRNLYGDPNLAGSSEDNINNVIMIVCKNFLKRSGGYQNQTDIELQNWVKNAFAKCRKNLH